MQQQFELEDGSSLKLTIARWFTPLGRDIDSEGITPDITVEFEEEDYENEYDRQLEEAKKILKIFESEDTIGLSIEKYNQENPQTSQTSQ